MVQDYYSTKFLMIQIKFFLRRIVKTALTLEHFRKMLRTLPDAQGPLHIICQMPKVLRALFYRKNVAFYYVNCGLF